MDDINDIHSLAKKMMCPEDDVQNPDAIPEYDADSEPYERVDDVDLDENDVQFGDDVQQQELLDEVPQNVPASVPKKRRIGREEKNRAEKPGNNPERVPGPTLTTLPNLLEGLGVVNNETGLLLTVVTRGTRSCSGKGGKRMQIKNSIL